MSVRESVFVEALFSITFFRYDLLLQIFYDVLLSMSWYQIPKKFAVKSVLCKNVLPQ